MKISAREADAFVRRKPDKLVAVLVYGPDAGLVKERAAALVATALDGSDDPFRLVELDGVAVSDDPARILDESASMSLTGEGRVVRIRQADEGAPRAADSTAKAFAPVLELTASEAFFVVEAGDLGPKSPLRASFEKAKCAAAVPCYVDDAEDLTGLVRRMVEAAGQRIDRQALDDLVARLGSDRLVSKGEIEKLILYKGAEGGTITADDVEAAVGDAVSVSLDDLAFATASGNAARVDAALQRAYREGVATVAIIRAVGRHLQRLMLASAAYQKGAPPKEAMSRLRPKVFWKQENEFTAQLQHWTPDNLARALEIVTEMELNAKTTGLPEAATCERGLIRIARAARAAA